MAEYLATDSDLTSVANAIRVKAEISGTIEFPDGFISAINSISGGGAEVEPISITENGTYTAPSGKAYSPVTVNVSGGGASNVVSGTFVAGAGEATTMGIIQTISIPYSGAGFPVAVHLFVVGGRSGNEACATMIKASGVVTFVSTLQDMTVQPDYQTGGTLSTISAEYKNSASSATSYTAAYSVSGKIYTAGKNPQAAWQRCVYVHDNTTLKVFVPTTSGYGLINSLEYQYYVIYSE